MAHSSSFRTATGQISALLLATTALWPNVSVNAEPLQPFWLMPSVMTATPDPSDPFRQLRPVHEQQQLKFGQHVNGDIAWSKFPALRPASTIDEDALALSRSEPADPAPVSVKLRTSSFEVEPSVNVKLLRLADAGLDTVAAQGTGFDATLFGGRVNFGTDIVQAVDTSDDRDFRDSQLRPADRAIRLTNSARRGRFAAKVIDSEHLRMFVDGEFGQTSEGFAHSLQEMPTGRLVLPGSWSTVSSRLEVGSARLGVDYQDYVSREQMVQRKGLTFAYARSAMSLYRKEGMEFNLTQGGHWLKRTSFSGIEADFIVADLLPDAVADAIDPVRPFLPRAINASFERGDIIRSELIPGPRDRVSTANVALMWESTLGQTTASYWERKINTDVIAPDGEDSFELSTSRDRFIDVSHKVRRGNWQFGAGLSMIDTDDSHSGLHSRDSQVAPHVSVAYAPEGGPTVELRLGAADAQSQLVDDNLAARSKTRQLQLSVDLSTFAQEELNKPDAKLKLEYRYDLSGSDRDPITNRERGGGHAVLLTFSTPLN